MRPDSVANLPVDKSTPSRGELEMADTVFASQPSPMKNVITEAKEAALVMVVVFILSLPQLDALLNRFVPMTQTSPYIGILIKSLVAAIVVWLVRYFYLSRKS